jgi:hypothetical protein
MPTALIFGGEEGRVVGRVTAAQGPAEKVQAEGNRGAEGMTQAWLRSGAFHREGPAIAAELRHAPEIGHVKLAQLRAPVLIRWIVPILRVEVRHPEKLMAHADASHFELRIVDAELAANDFEAGFEPRHGIGQARRAHRGISVHELPEGALLHDVIEVTAAGPRVRPEETGFVIVNTGGEIAVARRQVELRAILLNRIVAEDAECHVLVTPLGYFRRGVPAVGEQLLHGALPLGEHRQVALARLTHHLGLGIHFQSRRAPRRAPCAPVP